MIRVENVSKSFGSKKALHQISFEIKEGEIFGFLGPSGSGKTTMINVLTGQLAADQGKTVLLGKNSQDLTSNDLEQSFRVLFQLNQYVLHGLYILITIVSVLTREIQLLALLAVAVVHIYINLMQIPMIKRYFK